METLWELLQGYDKLHTMHVNNSVKLIKNVKSSSNKNMNLAS